MAKFTVTEARKLVLKSSFFCKNLKEALALIENQAKMGLGNTFIDLNKKDLNKIADELEKRGFNVWKEIDKNLYLWNGRE